MRKKDNIFYVCSLIEFIARATKNHRKDVVSRFTKEAIDILAYATRQTQNECGSQLQLLFTGRGRKTSGLWFSKRHCYS